NTTLVQSPHSSTPPPTVFVNRDTRPHSMPAPFQSGIAPLQHSYSLPQMASYPHNYISPQSQSQTTQQHPYMVHPPYTNPPVASHVMPNPSQVIQPPVSTSSTHQPVITYPTPPPIDIWTAIERGDLAMLQHHLQR